MGVASQQGSIGCGTGLQPLHYVTGDAIMTHSRNSLHPVVHSVPTDRQVQASMQMVTPGARGEHSNAQIQPESCLDRLID